MENLHMTMEELLVDLYITIYTYTITLDSSTLLPPLGSFSTFPLTPPPDTDTLKGSTPGRIDPISYRCS
jgi:hypothetical protein